MDVMRMRQTATIAAALAVTVVLVLVGATPVGAAPAADSGYGAATTQECSYPVTETDATGTDVTVDEEPARVVVLAPSAAQTMWELDVKGKIVGMPVNQYTAYLEGYDQPENVINDDGTVNRENVVALEPDIVLASNITPNETVRQLRDAGLTVYKPGFGASLADIYAKTELFGQLVGACTEAQQVVEETKSEVEAIRTAVEGTDRPRVLYYFFNFTAGNGTFIGEVIETAGGENVAASAGITGFDEVNPEMVAEQDPEWVVIPSDAQLPGGEPYVSTTAYQRNQTLVVDTNLISQPAPRVVQPMRKLAEAFHPDGFAETPTATEDGDTTPTVGTTTQTETADDGVGMGLATAFVALLAATMIAKRRS